MNLGVPALRSPPLTDLYSASHLISSLSELWTALLDTVSMKICTKVTWIISFSLHVYER